MIPFFTKQKLFSLYIKNKLSTYKIANIYKCPTAQVRQLLKKYKIKVRSKREAIILDRGIVVSKSYLTKLYLKDNLFSTQIASIINCDPSTVLRKLHEFGILIKPPAEKIRISKQELQDLYYRKTLSCNKIAKHFNCSIKTLRKRVRKYGILLRPNKKVIISKKTLENHYHKEKLSLREIGDLYNLVPAAVLRKMRKFNIPLRTSWEANIIYPKKPFAGSLQEKAYLIGFRLGDLGVTQKSKRTNSIIVKSNTTKIEQVTLMKNLFSQYSHVWISGPNAKGVFYFTTLLHPSFDFLVPKNDCIPDCIKNDIKPSLAFIAGYTDAEGSIGIYDGRAKFRIGSYDIGILKQIHKSFGELGVRSTLRLEQLKGFIDKRGIIYNGNFWRVCVNEKTS